MQILKEIKNQYIPPQFFETEIFTKSLYQDYPFKLYSYLDKEFSDYLKSPINQQYCSQFTDPEESFCDSASDSSSSVGSRVKSSSSKKNKLLNPQFKGTSYKVKQQEEDSIGDEAEEVLQSQLEQNQPKGNRQFFQSSFDTHIQSILENQDSMCPLKNEALFNETFIPLLYVHGHGNGNPQQINSLNQQLQKLLIYENEKNLEYQRQYYLI